MDWFEVAKYAAVSVGEMYLIADVACALLLRRKAKDFENSPERLRNPEYRMNNLLVGDMAFGPFTYFANRRYKEAAQKALSELFKLERIVQSQ